MAQLHGVQKQLRLAKGPLDTKLADGLDIMKHCPPKNP